MNKSTIIFILTIVIACSLIVAGIWAYSKTKNKSPNNPIKQIAGKEVVTIGFQTDPLTSLPFDLALGKKLFDKYNLQIESTSSATLSASSLGNSVDFYISKDLATSLVIPKEDKWIATTKRVFPFYLIAKKSRPIEKVAINPKGVDRAYLALAALNKDPKNIKFINTTSSETRYNTLLQNQADSTAITFSDKFFSINQQLSKDNNEIVFDAAGIKDFYYPEVVLSGPRLISQRPALIKPFIQAVEEAISYTRNNKNEAISLLTEKYHLTSDQAETEYQLYLASTENFEVKPNAKLLEDLFDKIRETTNSAKEFNPEQIIYNF